MPALADLIVPLSASTVIQNQLAFLALAGFPTTSWQSGSVPLSLIQADAQTLASMSQTIANIAAGGLLSTAGSSFLIPSGSTTSPWLDLKGVSDYGIPRKTPVATQGLATLTDAAGAGPFTITIGQLFAQSDSGLVYTNTTGGTLPKNGTLQLAWQAQSSGSAYNVANNTIRTLLTPLPGVTINNPDPGTGTQTWITQSGTDTETDLSYVTRCQARWPQLGGGANLSVYQAWAVQSAPGVTKSLALENTPVGGQVTLYCAGSSGSSPSSDVTLVQNYINSVRPLCVQVNVAAATANPFPLAGTVNVKLASLTSAQAAFATALTQFQAALPIGGTIYFSQLVDLIQKITGVQNVVFTSPSAGVDTAQSQNQVAVFSYAGLSFVGV